MIGAKLWPDVDGWHGGAGDDTARPRASRNVS
jgi:hypothetical protein